MKKDKRVDDINNLILELASGNFNIKGIPSQIKDEYDAIIIGINMLGEELEASTVSRDYLQNIFKGVVDMLMVVRTDNTFEKINNAVVNSLGFDEEDLLGKSFDLLLPPREVEKFNVVKSRLNEEGFLNNFETVLKTNYGKHIPVSISSSLLYNNENKVIGTLHVAKDISQIKETQQQLKTRNEELNAFAYKAFHDLKGPLATSKGLLNYAREKNEVESYEKILELIEKNIDSLNKTLSELLSFTVILNSANLTEKIKLEELLNSVLDELNKEFSGLPQINVEVKQGYKFISYRNFIRFVFYHLIKNALIFSEKEMKERKIKIEIENGRAYLNINISDNGIGIEEKIRDRIFDMFYQGSSLSSGPGLGLYIIKSILNRLRGRISFESIPGKGTTFYLQIPNEIDEIRHF